EAAERIGEFGVGAADDEAFGGLVGADDPDADIAAPAIAAELCEPVAAIGFFIDRIAVAGDEELVGSGRRLGAVNGAQLRGIDAPIVAERAGRCDIAQEVAGHAAAGREIGRGAGDAAAAQPGGEYAAVGREAFGDAVVVGIFDPEFERRHWPPFDLFFDVEIGVFLFIVVGHRLDAP